MANLDKKFMFRNQLESLLTSGKQMLADLLVGHDEGDFL